MLQNPKRLSNWALNISSGHFISALFSMSIVLYILSTHDVGIFGTHMIRTRTGNIFKKGRVLLAELPAIRSRIRCKRCFCRLVIRIVELLNYTAGGLAAGSWTVHISLFSTLQWPYYCIVPLSSFVLIRSLRFRYNELNSPRPRCQWRVNV